MVSLSAIPAREIKAVSLVSIAHGYSHFYMFALPPLFGILQADLGVAYAALGTLIAAQAIGTGFLQVPAGLLVDRIGGRPVLLGGLALNAAAFAAIGLVADFWMMLVFAAIAGVGNSVFHPCDYSILSAQVEEKRIGRAFGIHLFAGYGGWMLTPGVMLGLASIWDWRTAVVITGLSGLLFVAIAAWQGEALDDAGAQARKNRKDGEAKPAAGLTDQLKLMLTPAIAMFFLFYFALAASSSGIQTMAVVSIVDLHGMSQAQAGLALTAFFAAGAAGVLVGGWLADRTERHERLTAIVFVLMAIAVAAIGLRGLSSPIVVGLMFAGGFFLSLASPSRDKLVRRAAPSGTIGTVFGFVSVGFSLGLTVGPPIFGWMVDIGRPEMTFWLGAALGLLAILSVYGARSAAVSSREEGK